MTESQHEQNPALRMMQEGDYEGAQKALETSIELNKDIFGDVSAEVAEDWRNLGVIFFRKKIKLFGFHICS